VRGTHELKSREEGVSQETQKQGEEKMGTHRLESTEEHTNQNMKGKQENRECLQAREYRRKDNSGHGKNVSEQGPLTN
jgi:hypothetical protein